MLLISIWPNDKRSITDFQIVQRLACMLEQGGEETSNTKWNNIPTTTLFGRNLVERKYGRAGVEKEHLCFMQLSFKQ